VTVRIGDISDPRAERFVLCRRDDASPGRFETRSRPGSAEVHVRTQAGVGPRMTAGLLLGVTKLARTGNVLHYFRYLSVPEGRSDLEGKPTRTIGRPRDVRADRAILAATLELIAEHGVYEFRTEDVAARAGVGKGAIYRRYRSKDELVTAATAALVGREIAIPDTGSTRADLLVLMRDAVDLYRGALARRLMPNLIGAMAQKPALARSVRDGFLAGRRSALAEVLERGVERGDLRPDLDLELALDVLGGPLFYRLLVTGGPIDEQLAEGVADLILRGFAPEASRQSKSTRKRKEQQR
jgi:AcrR family transcriptional regulator